MAQKSSSSQPVQQPQSSTLISAPQLDSEKRADDQGQPRPIPIIGIGASAGGLEAFEIFFSHMPSNSGLAFVLIQHMSPKHDSALVELVQRFTSMRVIQINEAIAIEPNCVYITPPN